MSNRWLHNAENHSLNGMHTGLGAVLMCNYFNRLQCGIFGPNKAPPRQFTDAIWIDAGYALDAPESMPAGGMRAGSPICLGAGEVEEGLPEPMLVDREPASA